MSSAGTRSGAHTRPGQLPSAIAPSSHAVLLEKLNVRQSTPDSEAMASSDEEIDHHRQTAITSSVQQHKPVRRASWLTDTSQPANSLARKGSFASSSMSPTTSHPPTPAGDTVTWGSLSTSSAGVPRGAAGASSFPWSPDIWNNRKDASSRLAEVAPSPTTAGPVSGSSNGMHPAEGTANQMSPKQRDQPSSSQIPFPIPLHPTPKTYRSQSYSVGQMEADATAGSMGPSSMMGSRVRTIPHSGLQHRPSRPSMLSEMANDGSALGKVNEDDDDDSAGSMQGSQHPTAEANATIEALMRENAMLRQQQQVQPQQASRLRQRASSGMGGFFQEPVPEESDYAVDELDESNDGSDIQARRGLNRRMSEFGVGSYRSPFDRKPENVRKNMWQSQLGFNTGGDVSQSRRHSFAEIPNLTAHRQGSIVSLPGDSISTLDTMGQESHLSADPYESNFGTNALVPANYFGGGVNVGRTQQALSQPAYGQAAYGQAAYGQQQSAYGQYSYPSPQPGPYSNRSVSPHRGMYGAIPPYRPGQPVHIVLFKFARADVFYVPDDTGLTINDGDLVIVEADRGIDLGTVAKTNVDMQTARELKEHYAEEHYKWLMMYSASAASTGDGAGPGLMAASSGLGAAVGGMGPPNPHHVQEPNNGELKPKTIRRLALAHDVGTLREKEGNEAKAKRVCQQKVKEHGLNMEILDAEFQLDFRKLTFYYFADSYINFNTLVTDLFKSYKTRIWMSAVNPASFANPTIGLQAPSGIGPGAVGVGRGSQERRQANSTANEAATSSAFPSQTQTVGQRVIRPSNSHPSFNEQAVASPSSYGIAPAQYSVYAPAHYGAFGAPRPGAVQYPQAMMQPMDPFQSVYAQPTDYQQMGRGRYPGGPAANGLHDQGGSPLPMGSQGDWSAFQNLSLNGR